MIELTPRTIQCLETSSRSVQPFLQGSQSWSTHRQTHRRTDTQTTHATYRLL